MGTTENTEETDVVIVGGGIAGLTTAVGLCRAGLEVTVIERDQRLGGRAQSWTDPETGDPVHIGPHIFLSEYPNMFKLMDILGTRDRIVWQDDYFILMVEGRQETTMDFSPLPAPLQFMPSLLADETFPNLDILSNTAVTLYAMQMTEEDVMRLDGMNAYAFLRRMGVTERYIDLFWAFASMAIMNVPVELCSAGALMRFYKRLVGHNEYHFGFPDGGLGDVYAPQAKELIEEHGGTVLLDTEVVGFVGSRNRVAGVELADGRRILADHTVAALPPQALRSLARREWVSEHSVFSDLVHFQPSPYVSSFIWFDQKLTDKQMWARKHRANDLNCDFYDLSNIHTGWEDRPSIICSNIIYSERASHMSDDEIIEATVDEISDYLPEASMERVTHTVVNRIPMAIHCPFPGTERRRPPTRTPVRGLLLAGDWIKTGLPSSMESAAMSGWMAAEEVLRDVGRPETLSVEHDTIEGITGVVHRTAEWLPSKSIRRLVRSARRRLTRST